MNSEKRKEIRSAYSKNYYHLNRERINESRNRKGTERVNCPVCDRNLARSTLPKHLKSQHPDDKPKAERVNCPVCDRQLARSSLKYHLISQHSPTVLTVNEPIVETSQVAAKDEPVSGSFTSPFKDGMVKCECGEAYYPSKKNEHTGSLKHMWYLYGYSDPQEGIKKCKQSIYHHKLMSLKKIDRQYLLDDFYHPR